eukprot:symbB.v1.2.018579.t1/scaffold1486.1/size115809/4
MALGWQPQSHALPDVPDAEDSAPKIKGVAAVNGHKEVQSKAIDKAKALALATCESTPPSKEEGRGIFVGGLPVSVDDGELRKHFEAYGAVQDATVVLNQRTGKSKGFGFVEFRDAGIREAVMQKSVQIQGKVVEVKVRQAKGGKGKPREATLQCGRRTGWKSSRTTQISCSPGLQIRGSLDNLGWVLLALKAKGYAILELRREDLPELKRLYGHSREFFQRPSRYKEPADMLNASCYF